MTLLSQPDVFAERHNWQYDSAFRRWYCVTHCSASVHDFDIEDYELLTGDVVGLPSGLHLVWRWKRRILDSGDTGA